MPTLIRPVSELTNHIYMPVCKQLCHRILKALDYEDVIGDRIYINADWSTHSITFDKNDNANISQTRFTAEVNLQLNPMSQKWDTYTFHHTTAYGFGKTLKDRIAPVYWDKPNHTRIIEMVSPITIELNCELYLASAELAFQTPQQIFNGYENGSIWHYTDLFYDYPVPKPIVTVLYGIWKIDRVYGEPAKVPFTEYIDRHSNGTWAIKKHRDLEEYEITIPCYDIKTLCTLEYSEDKPQGVMEDKLPVGWNIPFRYTIQFGIPTLDALIYPIVVNNQLLPDKYIAREQNTRYNSLPEYRHNPAYSNYEKGMYDKPYFSYTVPWYDDWQLPPTTKIFTANHVPLVCMHLLVDETEHLETKIDLKEDFDKNFEFGTFIKTALAELKSNACDINAPVCVWLYRDDDELVPNSDFSISDNLELRFIATNLSVNYHACITYNKDIYNIRPKYYGQVLANFDILPDNLKRSIVERFLRGDWRYFMTAAVMAYQKISAEHTEFGSSDVLMNVRNNYYNAIQWQLAKDNLRDFPYYTVAILSDGTVTFNHTAVFKVQETEKYINDIYYFTINSKSFLLDQTPTNVIVRVTKDDSGAPQEIHYPGEYSDNSDKQTLNISNEVLPHANYTNAGITRYSIIARETHKS